MRRKLLNPLVFLLFLYFATRLFQLFSVPVFSDEGIYMSWGNAFYDRLHREFPFFIAADGKQTAVPFTLGLMQMLPLDPLLSVRLVSIVAGAIASITIFKSFRILFPQISSVLFLLLLIFTPYTLFFDRLALPEAIAACSYRVASLLLHPMYQSSPMKDTLRITLSGIGSERLVQKVVRQITQVSQWLVNFVSPFAVIVSVIAIGMVKMNKK